MTEGGLSIVVRSGKYEDALEYLQRSIDLGLANGQWIMNDNDLVPLHEHPRFIEMIARLG